MKKRGLFLIVCLISIMAMGWDVPGQAASAKPVLYFWGDGCPACKDVAPVIEKMISQGVPIEKHEVYNDKKNMDYLAMLFKVQGIPEQEWAIPVAFHNGKMYMGVPRILELEKESANE